MTAQAACKRGGRRHYDPRPAAVAVPLARSGLYAVHIPEPAGAATSIYYCEPETGRCSCGAAPRSCPHIAAAHACAAWAVRDHSPLEEAA